MHDAYLVCFCGHIKKIHKNDLNSNCQNIDCNCNNYEWAGTGTKVFDLKQISISFSD